MTEVIGRSGDQYVERLAAGLTGDDRRHTTLLVSGLTLAQDRFVSAALGAYGFRVTVLDVPDNAALHMGKEFGNRGQCNPTYFTVGNLLKFLFLLRDRHGLTTEEIIRDYAFVTAGACGPCRFGTYVTEYRKALRDSGFEGFRVLTVSQTAEGNQSVLGETGRFASLAMYRHAITALVLGDILNARMYAIRPYEKVPGETDRVIAQCRDDLELALSQRRSLLAAARRCGRRLGAIGMDRSLRKPRVAILGEFWAMTTEGDGNYHLQRYLESQGAEVDIQLVTAWFLYLIWQGRNDTRKRQALREQDSAGRGLLGTSPWRKRLLLGISQQLLLGTFFLFARCMGLRGYSFTDMDELAALSQSFYDTDLRGGEGHMEVGKVILNALKPDTHMTISVKPFGCMPSSAVSDGVQSKIVELYPDLVYLPIETTGDGAVNVYSRIQMQLHRARKLAESHSPP
jgi:predicted nucleotide-binding protein (sugar kinase/HSP70/actin superfamily)